MSLSIHDTCIIDNDVIIGEGTKIWAFSHIMRGARIGKNCVVGEGVHIGEDVVIGDGCKIQNHSILYRGVVLGCNVFFGPNVVTTNDIDPIASDDNWDSRFKKTVFKDGCSIGANATIVCGNVIGENSLVGAGSVVVSDVYENTVFVGNPARFLRIRDNNIK